MLWKLYKLSVGLFNFYAFNAVLVALYSYNSNTIFYLNVSQGYNNIIIYIGYIILLYKWPKHSHDILIVIRQLLLVYQS